MKASELRLGNFVLFASEGKQFTVKELSIGGIEVSNTEELVWIEIEEFEGIPLSEEWLEKFGFDSKASTTWSEGPDNPIDYKVYKKGRFTYNTFQEAWWYNGLLEYQPKYVHQLQNLYFALTGQELTVKELDKA